MGDKPRHIVQTARRSRTTIDPTQDDPLRMMFRSLLVCTLLAGCGGAPTGPVSTVPPGIADPGFLEQYAKTHRFRAGRPSAVRLTPDGTRLFFLRSGPRSAERVLYRVDPKTGAESVFLTAKGLLGGDETALSPEEKALRERMRLSARGIARYGMSSDGSRLIVPLSGRRYLVDPASGDATVVGPKGVTAALLSPDNRRMAMVIKGDVHVLNVATQQSRRLTKRAEGISYGRAEFVAQEEMGRYAGMWFGPQSKRLVYQQTDERAVERFLITDPVNPASRGQSWPYPRPGKANAQVRLFIAPLDAAGEPTEIQWDHEAFPYVAQVRWPKAAPLTVTVQNRRQTVLRVLTVDPNSGETRTLIEEQDAAWINLDQQTPRWLPGGSAFLWTTERNGGWQLELRDRAGALMRTLNPVELGYRSMAWLDARRRQVWVYAGADPTQQHLYRLHLDGGPPEQLTTAPGQHFLTAARAAPIGVLTHYPAEGAPTWSLIDLPEAGPLPAARAQLVSKAETPPFEAKPTVTTVTLTDDDGAERVHYASLVRPRNFKSGLRYPVILSIYAGPGVNVVRRVSRWQLFDQWLADHGFIVVKIDGRGTPLRGRAWERIIKGDMVTVPLADQVGVLKALAEAYPELDVQRVGVSGWSYGGYMAAMATIRRPDVFQAGVAGAPVADWRDYDTHYTERFLGLPDTEKAAYDTSSVLTYAAQLERPLLIIHGTADDNVYLTHALKLSNALFSAGKPHDFLPLAGQTHMVRDPKVIAPMYGRIVAHLRAHLGRPQPLNK